MEKALITQPAELIEIELPDVDQILTEDDTLHQLSKETLRVYERRRGQYQKMREVWFEEVGLGLRLWEGSYENKEATWLRWCDRDGQLIPTGAELVQLERQRADRAEAELARLKAELGRADSR